MQKKKIIIAIVAVTILYIGWAIYSTTKVKDIDRIPPDTSSEIDFFSQVYVVDGEKLFTALGSPERYDAIGQDLYYFAKKTYEKYKDREGVIGFEITSDIKLESKSIQFSGRFGANNNRINVSVELLHKNRITTSINDTKQQISLNEELPSNSRGNQFIGILPIETAEYSIDYDDTTALYIINIFNNSGNYEAARERLREALGEEALQYSDDFVFMGAIFENNRDF